jgi:iron(III) transport system substrate-binding protein
MFLPPRRWSILLALFILIVATAACQPPAPPTAPTAVADPEPAASPEADPEPAATLAPTEGALLIYSGRSEDLVGPLIDLFEQQTGIETQVRYGETAEMAATIMEEGQNSPADIFFAQDAGALGVLSSAGRLHTLADDLLATVPAAFRSAKDDWVGASGRARVVVFNTNELQESELPSDIWGFADPAWKGKLGWAPTNGSFQAFVTALRLLEGEDQARAWLQAMIANEIKEYPNNTAIVEAVGKGEISAGFVNHYYLLRFKAEQGDAFPAANHFLTAGDAGAMVNVAGAGILTTSKQIEIAERFITFLLGEQAQAYFAANTNEYPLRPGAPANPALKPLAEIRAPELDLNRLDDLQATLALLQDVGALQ